MKERRQKS